MLHLHHADTDPFGHILLQQLRLLPERSPAPPYPDLHFERRRHDGSWQISNHNGRIIPDDLDIGATAARYLASLHCQVLIYAGPPNDNLRWRGFAISAAALRCAVLRLDDANADTRQAGIFADGARAEAAAMQFARQQHLQTPADLLVLGIDDGQLPAPTLSGIARLHLDPVSICAAMTELAARTRKDRDLLIPAVLTSRHHQQQDSADPHLQLMLNYIQAHLHRELDIAMLADAAGLSRRSLERLCRHLLGHSPLEEIHQQRVARARSLMQNSELRLEDIAARVGFSSADRLRLVFKKLTGMTPQDWRQRYA